MTPTPTVTPTPQCSPVDLIEQGTYPNVSLAMACPTPQDAIIFYQETNETTTPPNPTHNGASPTNGTQIYSGPIGIPAGRYRQFKALAYKAGYIDSVITSGIGDNTDPNGGGGNAPANSGDTTTRTVSYTLDKAGNRTGPNGVTENNSPKSYTPNALNQYTTAEGSLVTNGLEHEISSFNGVSYSYINDEHLKQVTLGANTYQMFYDALGRCVKRTLNTVTTYYIYDGEKPILEYNGAGALVAANLYGSGIDEILMRSDYTISPTRVLFYQDDHEGSITHLTSATGAVMESYRYDAFGAPTIKDETGSVVSTSVYKNRFLFTGREYAEKFGIYEYRNRAYHPQLGRFTSEDPKGYDAGDYNLFRYCGNDPADKTDPMGLEGTPERPEFRISYVQGLKNGVHLQYFRFHPTPSQFHTAQSREPSGTPNGSGRVHDPVIDGKNYDQSSDLAALVRTEAYKAQDELQRHPYQQGQPLEVSTYISQNKNGSKDYLGHPLEVQSLHDPKENVGKNGSYMYSRFRKGEKDPSPKGYKVVAGIVAQRIYSPRMSKRDQREFKSAGYDGYTVTPGPTGHPEKYQINHYQYPDEPR